MTIIGNENKLGTAFWGVLVMGILLLVLGIFYLII